MCHPRSDLQACSDFDLAIGLWGDPLPLNRLRLFNAHILSIDAVMRTDSSEMTDVESVISSFASSARAGRRNALPDIQSSAATGGSSDLPLKLEALSMKEGNTNPLK